MVAHLHQQPYGAYVMRMPDFIVGSMSIRNERGNAGNMEKKLSSQYFVFIRLPVIQGEKEAPPSDGTRVELEADTTVAHGKHVPNEAAWHGTVIRKAQAVHDALGTDFCMLMHKPPKAQSPSEFFKFGDLKRLKDIQMWSVRLNVILTHIAESREQTAIEQFLGHLPLSTPTMSLRHALFSESWPTSLDIVDLTRGPSPKNAEEATTNQKRYQDNLVRRKKKTTTPNK